MDELRRFLTLVGCEWTARSRLFRRFEREPGPRVHAVFPFLPLGFEGQREGVRVVEGVLCSFIHSFTVFIHFFSFIRYRLIMEYPVHN